MTATRSMSPLGIMQKTSPEANGTDQADGMQGRGDSAKRPRGRPKDPNRPKKAGRKLTIPAPVFLRLSLEALKTGRTMSAIATELLDAGLPKHRITTDVKAPTAAAAE